MLFDDEDSNSICNPFLGNLIVDWSRIHFHGVRLAERKHRFLLWPKCNFCFGFGFGFDLILIFFFLLKTWICVKVSSIAGRAVNECLRPMQNSIFRWKPWCNRSDGIAYIGISHANRTIVITANRAIGCRRLALQRPSPVAAPGSLPLTLAALPGNQTNQGLIHQFCLDFEFIIYYDLSSCMIDWVMNGLLATNMKRWCWWLIE